ncbi:hypothetical protein NQZ79_g2943 [Umbelopsis isabellina]|nr:hypothetical protein NQZ79_g2943 [Umbelopsis isabellina]
MSPLVNIDTIRDMNLQSPLHLACKRKDNFENSTAIATLLIDHGCDVNNAICDNDGMLPLHYAVLSGNVDCVIMLLVKGATIPISDPFRLTPLLLAKAEIEKTERRHLLHTRPEFNLSSDTEFSLKNLRQITALLLDHIKQRHTEDAEAANGSPSYGLSNSLLARKQSTSSGYESDLDVPSIVDRMRSMSVSADDNIDSLISKMQAFGVKPA